MKKLIFAYLKFVETCKDDELILEYGNDEIWSKTPSKYYFNERQSWANVHIPEGSNITEVEGYCQFLMEKEVIGAELVGDRVYAL